MDKDSSGDLFMPVTFDQSFQHELAVESWTLYAFGISFIVLRLFSRVRIGGIGSLSVDDSLMLLVGVLYTMLIVCLNVIAGTGSNLFPPEQFSTFTPEDIQQRIIGSKVVVVSEQAMLNLIYVLKACMICIYGRLTLQLKHAVFVKAVAAFSVCGYVASQLAFFLTCRPFYGYWQVPANMQCTTLQHYAITQACFNITSDALMLAISIPLLISTALPKKQKIVLVVIFGMGIFVILAAILTKVYNLRNPYSTVYMLWYVRESSVAILVVNLPLLWPLLRNAFPWLATYTPGQTTYVPDSKWRGFTVQSSAQRTKLGTHISIVDRGLEMVGMDKMFKRHDSCDQNMGGINQLKTIDIEITHLDEKQIRRPSDLESQKQLNGCSWDPEIEMFQTYHTKIRAGQSVSDQGGLAPPPPERQRAHGSI